MTQLVLPQEPDKSMAMKPAEFRLRKWTQWSLSNYDQLVAQGDYPSWNKHIAQTRARTLRYLKFALRKEDHINIEGQKEL